MSVLQTPRILFKGEISWDPITTNNYNEFYDEDTDSPVWPDVTDKVKAFRQEAINAVCGDLSWDPHGTHRAVFYNTAISGVDLGEGVVTTDPFVKSVVNFMGMLVDLEPYGTFTSQLFFDSMQFGISGGYRIFGKRLSRLTARYVNFTRNPANAMIAGVASVVWQTSFSKDALGVQVDAFDSPALQALAAALRSDDALGLTVRFNTYRTVYFDNLALTTKSPLTSQAERELSEKLRTGGFQPNPARSVLVGVIGLWRRSEPMHEPGDRALLTPAASPVGSAHARLEASSLTIDLSNSIPETSKDLEKANLGALSVVAVSTGGSTTQLGTLPYAQYDRRAYEAGSGIVCLALTQDQAKAATNNPIQVLAGNGSILLAEASLRAIPATPNLYLDEGTTATAAFQVYKAGIPAKEVLPVTLYKMSADGGSVESTGNYQTDANGMLSLPVEGTAGGVFAYVASPDPAAPPPSSGINAQVNTYMYVRTLAADKQLAGLPSTWENVYAKVLANWNAMAPCMDNWLMLDDPVQVKARAALLKRLTDPANFESFLFMPVTRDMTAGGRTLLYKFLDAPGGPQPAALVKTPETGPDFARQSRSLRRPQTG
jgi:hypothetical protein